MSRIVTIRASEANEAIELALTRLGEDALIVATRSVPGGIEIDAIQSIAETSFAQHLNRQLARPSEDRAGATLGSSRILLLATAGTPVSGVAAALGKAMIQRSDRELRLVGDASCADDLWQIADPLDAEVGSLANQMIAPPVGVLHELWCMSAEHGRRSIVEEILGEGGCTLCLALPTGLRRARIAQLVEGWRDLDPSILLCATGDMPAEDYDLRALDEARFPALWIAETTAQELRLAPQDSITIPSLRGRHDSATPVH